MLVANGLVAVRHAEIRISDSAIGGGRVFFCVGYMLGDWHEMCCSYTEYEIANGRMIQL